MSNLCIECIEELRSACSEFMCEAKKLRQALRNVQAIFTRGVYLAGAINGVTPEFAAGWRQKAGDILRRAGYTVYDPTAGKDLEHPAANTALYNPAEIVEGDLGDIEKSRIILVEASRDDVPYWGTAMEIRYAYELGKTIIVWGPTAPSYWLQYHATEIFETLDEALAFILNTFGPFGKSTLD